MGKFVASYEIKYIMKHLKGYYQAQETSTVKNGEINFNQNFKLVDVITDQELNNPSLMLWAILGLSAEHSYILAPLT
jgi:hypothetical protein